MVDLEEQALLLLTLCSLPARQSRCRPVSRLYSNLTHAITRPGGDCIVSATRSDRVASQEF